MRPTPLVLAAGFALLLPLAPVSAATLTVTGVSHTGGLYAIDVPTVEVDDGNLDEATIRAIFNGNAAVAAPALAGLDARAIRIPSITLRPNAPPDAPVTVYRDIEIRDVVDGVAASAVLGGTDVTGAENVSVTLNRTSVSNLDVGALLSFYGLGGDTPPTEPVTIYSDIRFEGGKVAADKVVCTIGPAEIAEFKARPPKGGTQGIMDLAARAQAEEQAGSIDPKTLAALIAAYVDVLSAFEISPMEFAGITCDGFNDKDSPLKVVVGALSLGGWHNSVFPPVTLTDFDVTVEREGFVRFASATLKQMDFTNTLAAFLAAGENIDEDWFEKNWPAIMPAIGGFSVSGLELDVPDTERRGDRVKFSLGSLDVNLGGYTNGIPANSEISVAGLTVPVPEDGEDMSRALREAGIGEVTLGFGGKFDWDLATSTATISNLNMVADGLGSMTLAATLGNVTPEVFSPDQRTQMRASRLITLKDLKIQLNNAGLLPILIAEAAREAGQNEAQFRTGLVGIAAGTAMALLGASPQTLGTVTAFSDFIAGRPVLDVALTAVDPRGVGIADFELMQKDPRLLAGRIQVTATASGDMPPEPAAAPATPTQGSTGEATSAQ